MIIFLIFGGVAVDSSNAWRMRAELQYTADAAALAGIVELPVSPDTVKSTAIAMAVKNMPTGQNGNVLVENDVLIGVWNGVTFTETNTAPNAVSAITRRDEANLNRLKTYFLRLVGKDSWNVSALAIAAINWPECVKTNTIYAGGIVDFKSVHNFYSPVCVHGEEGVKVRNQNLWGTEEEGSFVDITVGQGMELWMPESDPEFQNPYITWHEDSLPPKLTNHLGEVLASYSDGLSTLDSTDYDEYMEGMVLPGTVDVSVNQIQNITSAEWDVDTYVPGSVYNVSCGSDDNSLQIYNTQTITELVTEIVQNDDGTTQEVTYEVSYEEAIPYVLQDIVLVTNCYIDFGSNNQIYDAVIGSTAGDEGAKPQHNVLKFGSNNQLGVDGDGCDPSGNVTFISTASLKMAAGNNIYGVQFLATNDMHISAGTESAADFQFQAGGDVFFAANSDFGDPDATCDEEDELLEHAYFRLVR